VAKTGSVAAAGAAANTAAPTGSANAVGSTNRAGSTNTADCTTGPLPMVSRSFAPINENLSFTRSYFRPRVPPRKEAHPMMEVSPPDLCWNWKPAPSNSLPPRIGTVSGIRIRAVPRIDRPSASLNPMRPVATKVPPRTFAVMSP